MLVLHISSKSFNSVFFETVLHGSVILIIFEVRSVCTLYPVLVLTLVYSCVGFIIDLVNLVSLFLQFLLLLHVMMLFTSHHV